MSRSSLITLTGVYIALLLVALKFTVEPLYAYMGYFCDPPSIVSLLVAAGVAIAPSFWIIISGERASHLTVYLLYYLLYIPACIIPICVLQNSGILFFSKQQFCLLLCMAILTSANRLPMIHIPSIPGKLCNLFWPVAVLALVITNVAIIRHFGFSIQLHELSSIYDVRDEFTHTLSSVPGPLAYLITWQQKVIAPAVILHGIVRKRADSIAFGVLSEFIVFSISGLKGALGYLFFVLGAYILIRTARNKLANHIVALLIVLILVCVLADTFLFDPDQVSLSGLIVRRTMLTPGLLTGYYYEFFTYHPKALLGHSILRSVIPPPYSTSPAKLVGLQYYGNLKTHANANFWSDGFANFGFGGMFAVTILLATLFYFVDCISRSKNTQIAAVILACSSLSLIDSGLLTTLATHGLGLSVLLLYFMPERAAKRVGNGNAFSATLLINHVESSLTSRSWPAHKEQ